MSEAWAAIIAAVIGVVGTLLATKFDDIVNLFRRPSRKIAGKWEGSLNMVDTDPRSYHPYEAEYNITITQTGEKIEGAMVETKVSKGLEPYKHNWKGKVVNEFLVYQSSCDEPERFLVFSGILFINPTGREMHGHFVANAGEWAPSGTRTWVGYTKLRRRG